MCEIKPDVSGWSFAHLQTKLFQTVYLSGNKGSGKNQFHCISLGTHSEATRRGENKHLKRNAILERETPDPKVGIY